MHQVGRYLFYERTRLGFILRSSVLISGFTISDDASVDQNSLASCVSRNEAFPVTKPSACPINTCDLVGADQIPSMVPGLDIHKRLTQIGKDAVDFSRSKRRGASLIQPNRGRRDSLVSSKSSSTIVQDGSAPTVNVKHMPRNSLGLKSPITSNNIGVGSSVSSARSPSIATPERTQSG